MTTLKYSLPSGWKTTSESGIEVGYNPSKAIASSGSLQIADIKGGGSRYIWGTIIDKPEIVSINSIIAPIYSYQKTDKEIEKHYAGNKFECLIVYNINLITTQELPTLGICLFNNGKILRLETFMNPQEMNLVLGTIRLTN